MTFRSLRFVVPALVVVGAATACSSKPPVARAYVNASANSGSNNNCNYGGSAPNFIVIGSDIAEGGHPSNDPTREDNGANYGGPVTVSCSVKPDGSSFDIKLTAAVDSTVTGRGGSMTIVGSVDPTQPSNGGISASFDAAGTSYSESDCTITFPFETAGPAVAAGRIWAQVDCPKAVATNKVTTSGSNPACDITAEFVFENCGE